MASGAAARAKDGRNNTATSAAAAQIGSARRFDLVAAVAGVCVYMAGVIEPQQQPHFYHNTHN